jgi:hypothetical protein
MRSAMRVCVADASACAAASSRPCSATRDCACKRVRARKTEAAARSTRGSTIWACRGAAAARASCSFHSTKTGTRWRVATATRRTPVALSPSDRPAHAAAAAAPPTSAAGQLSAAAAPAPAAVKSGLRLHKSVAPLQLCACGAAEAPAARRTVPPPPAASAAARPHGRGRRALPQPRGGCARGRIASVTCGICVFLRASGATHAAAHLQARSIARARVRQSQGALLRVVGAPLVCRPHPACFARARGAAALLAYALPTR